MRVSIIYRDTDGSPTVTDCRCSISKTSYHGIELIVIELRPCTVKNINDIVVDGKRKFFCYTFTLQESIQRD